VCYKDPSTTTTSSSPLLGLEVELLTSFATEVGLDIEFIEVKDFDGIWRLPLLGLSDTCIGGITYGKERDEEGIAWSCAYFNVTRTLVYHRHWPVVGEVFPQGVEGKIRATPGTTGYIDAVYRLKEANKIDLLEVSIEVG